MLFYPTGLCLHKLNIACPPLGDPTHFISVKHAHPSFKIISLTILLVWVAAIGEYATGLLIEWVPTDKNNSGLTAPSLLKSVCIVLVCLNKQLHLIVLVSVVLEKMEKYSRMDLQNGPLHCGSILSPVGESVSPSLFITARVILNSLHALHLVKTNHTIRVLFASLSMCLCAYAVPNREDAYENHHLI